MGKPTGLIEFNREIPKRRPVDARVRDWDEVYTGFPVAKIREQGPRRHWACTNRPDPGF